MKSFSFLPIIILLLLPGCSSNPQTPPKTQLEIREFQTRTYDTKDTKMVMKSMLNVLQDDGYIVKNANVELGLITATKEVDVEDKTNSFFASLFSGSDARWNKDNIIESSANISDHGNQTRVRINFQFKMLNNRGEVVEVKQIEDAKYYQEFFSKVDKGIFIQKEKL